MKRKVNTNSLNNLTPGRSLKIIDFEELLELKNKGWSLGRLANKFSCSRSTIKTRLKQIQPKEKDESIMSFALKLEMLAREAPTTFCKNQIMREVNSLRTKHAASRAEKKLIILKSFLSPDTPQEAEEIAEDCGFPLDDTLELLTEMVRENRLESRTRGGVLNRGRKIKYQYFLIKN